MNNVVKNGLYGFAIGDAMGVPIEFTPRVNDDSKKLTEMVGYGSHYVPEGTWSDDTSMTIATMDSIQECKGIDYYDIMNKFTSWYNNASYTATDKVFDIGNTTHVAIDKYYRLSINPILCGGKNERDNGNGSLMRMFPIAIYLYYNNLNEQKEMEIVKNISSLTHAHDISILGCKIYVDFIKEILSGKSKEEAYNSLSKNDYSTYFDTDTIEKYSSILNGNLKDKSIDEIKSSGYVVSTLEACLWCTLNTKTYEESIVEAINLGKDTDTVGAITGSLTGLIYGYENIPQRWLSKLRKKEYLDEIVDKFNNYLSNENVKAR